MIRLTDRQWERTQTQQLQSLRRRMLPCRCGGGQTSSAIRPWPAANATARVMTLALRRLQQLTDAWYENRAADAAIGGGFRSRGATTSIACLSTVNLHCGLCTVDPMAAIWQRHHLSASASLFAAATSSLGSGWVASHSVRAATNGSIPLFRHHDASSPQRWISR